MHLDPLSTIDPYALLNVPRLSAKGTAALARAIVAARPAQLPPGAGEALASLVERLEAFEQALMRARRSHGLQSPGQEAALDNAVDGVWMRLRDRLDDWTIYERPGFAALVDADDGEVDYGRLLAQAKRARDLRQRLFSLDGVSFVRLPYPEQAESMRSILKLIEEDELADEIDDLVGDDLVPTLRDLQQRYEDMVSRRADRSQAKDQADNLRLHQLGIQRAIRRYAAVMFGSYDDAEPASGQRVYGALKPILTFRERVSRSGGVVVEVDEFEDALEEFEQDADEMELEDGSVAGPSIESPAAVEV